MWAIFWWPVIESMLVGLNVWFAYDGAHPFNAASAAFILMMRLGSGRGSEGR